MEGLGMGMGMRVRRYGKGEGGMDSTKVCYVQYNLKEVIRGS
jgi:hypothetical protein